MINYVSILEQNPSGVMATKNNEKVKTRVFQYLFAEGKKIYFCTSSEKAVYAQMQSDANASFCTYPPNFAPVLSLSGKVTFVEDTALKERALAENPLLQTIYGSAKNPIFKMLYLEIAEIETFSLAEGLKQYRLD